jgi:hypothetical protein
MTGSNSRLLLGYSPDSRGRNSSVLWTCTSHMKQWPTFQVIKVEVVMQHGKQRHCRHWQRGPNGRSVIILVNSNRQRELLRSISSR